MISNAIKYNTQNGTITIEVKNKNDLISISVKDTGIGMTPEEIVECSQAFARLSKIGQGVGLGLSITQNIISLMGGILDITSEKGRGTTFEVLLDKED